MGEGEERLVCTYPLPGMLMCAACLFAGRPDGPRVVMVMLVCLLTVIGFEGAGNRK